MVLRLRRYARFDVIFLLSKFEKIITIFFRVIWNGY